MKLLSEYKPGDIFVYYSKKPGYNAYKYFDMMAQIIWGVVLGHKGQKTQVISFIDRRVISTSVERYNITWVSNKVKITGEGFPYTVEYPNRYAVMNIFEFKSER